MTEQGRQSHEVSWILRQIVARKGMAQRMCARPLRDQLACRFDEIVDHLSHRRGGQCSSFLTLEEGFKGMWSRRFGPFGGDSLDRRLADLKSWSHVGRQRFTGRGIERNRAHLIPFARPNQEQTS